MFTDVDCSYCRKLHSQIADYNRLGIKVRYLFYPRSGPDTESWEKAEEVWCSSEPQRALTRAKRGEEITGPKHCAGSPVAREYAVGQEVGVRGTPAIVLDRRRDAAGLPAAAPCSRSTCAAHSPRRAEAGYFSSSFSLSGLPSHSLASAGASFFSVITGHWLATAPRSAA